MNELWGFGPSGILEEWKIGMMEFFLRPFLYRSDIPVFLG